MTALEGELGACGGAAAPPSATARLRQMLAASLRHGRAELSKPRSGYEEPVEIGIAVHDGLLLAATPAGAALRADPQVATGREWLLVAATVGALVDLADPGPASAPEAIAIRAGELPGGFLVLGYPAPDLDAATLDELVPLAFAGHADLDRLRAQALALPAGVIDEPELRDPIGAGHPLRVAEAVARLGGRAEDPRDVEAHEEAVYAVLGRDGAAVRPHEDPDPGLRVARRILQRLDGMGKWGGYHTEFAHLARGFAGNDRALAQKMGEALLAAGLLAEKPSVGQRHVYLNPGKAAEIRRMIETGAVPPGMTLPSR
jgi:hypothetical protein